MGVFKKSPSEIHRKKIDSRRGVSVIKYVRKSISLIRPRSIVETFSQVVN